MNQPTQPSGKPPIMRPWILILLVVVILGAAAYWWFAIRNNSSSSTTTAGTSPSPTAVASASGTPATSTSSGTKTSPASTAPTKTYTGKTNYSSESCIATVSFNYPATITVTAPATTPHDVSPITTDVGIIISSVFQKSISPQDTASAVCTTYSSIEDYRSKNSITNPTKTFTTPNGYSAIEYNTTVTQGIATATAIQNPTNKNIVTVTTPTLVSATQATMIANMEIIANSLKFK